MCVLNGCNIIYEINICFHIWLLAATVNCQKDDHTYILMKALL